MEGMGGCAARSVPDRKDWGVVMVPARVVERWEEAYRAYGKAAEALSRSEPGDRNVARTMATASRDVAVAWQELAEEPELPWWMVAALGAATQAFEVQARDWKARAEHGASRATGGQARPSVQAMSPSPQPDHSGG